MRQLFLFTNLMARMATQQLAFKVGHARGIHKYNTYKVALCHGGVTMEGKQSEA
jgi:hypothetical protein